MAVVRDRMRALLLERGPLTSMQVAAALDVSQSMASNAGRELVAAGRATHTGTGAPWVGVPSDDDQVDERHGTTRLSRSKVEALRERVASLPIYQQALVIEGSPFDEARILAMARALRAYPDAARAVAIALRGITE